MLRFQAISLERYRANAAEQRKRGLKVGGTVTKFLVRDNETGKEDEIIAYGATPGDRKTAAIEEFKRKHNIQPTRGETWDRRKG